MGLYQESIVSLYTGYKQLGNEVKMFIFNSANKREILEKNLTVKDIYSANYKTFLRLK